MCFKSNWSNTIQFLVISNNVYPLKMSKVSRYIWHLWKCAGVRYLTNIMSALRPLQEQSSTWSSGSRPTGHFIIWSFYSTGERLDQAWRCIFCICCIPKYNSNEILSHSRTVLLIYCTALLFHYFARVLLYAWTLDRSTTHRSKTHRKSVKLPWRRNIFFFCLVVFLSSCLVVFLSRL